ncbi:MAG: hypothetical protein NTV43_18335 [Methylococcales bacterium]|nr:hypothetical protein [Methylococcales bacterium]
MKSPNTLIPLLLLAFISGCGGQDEPTPQPKAPVVFQGQLEALEKAKQVEGMLKNDEENQRKLIEETLRQQGQ